MKLKFLYKLLSITFYFFAAVSISACAGLFDFGSTSWKEEVQLSDGRVIVVERETIRETGGDEWAFNRSGTKTKEYKIWLADPDGSGKTIEWRSTKIDIQTWPEVPLVLDFESGQMILFSSGFNSGGCHIYSKYYYLNGAWVEEPLPEKFEQRMTNLLIFDDKNMQQFINLAEKRKKNSDSHTQGFRQVGPDHKICG